MKISLTELNTIIEERYIERGKKILKKGSVYIEYRDNHKIKAYVIGTGIYHITLIRDKKNNKLSVDCSCPAFDDFGPCKHLAATILASLDETYKSDEWHHTEIKQYQTVMNFLEKTPKKKLITIITHFMNNYPESIYEVAEDLGIDTSEDW